jgi:hypothetical protein
VRLVTVSMVTAGLVLLPQPSQAASISGLTISVPGTASLGSVATGSSQVSGSLGSVTVSTGVSVGTGSWVATVVSTAFTTGGGTTYERVAASSVRYSAGAVTATSGVAAGLCTPGQALGPESLDTTRTAMSCGGISLLSATSVTWRPTLTITLPASAVAGTYSGTVTHSVA